MLMDLKQALKPDDSFPLTLSFAKAGQIAATAIVQKAGATMPSIDRDNRAAWALCRCRAVASSPDDDEPK
jgi:hypothetical protein